MDLLQMYHAVNEILDTIDFNALFKGFHKYRFALYTSKEIILDEKSMPGREDFRGNTAKEYEGEYIAIWNMEFDPVEDVERLAYLLVHEMFHCHQYTNELISPGGENLLDFLELRQVLSTYDGDLRDPLWWPQERPVPMRFARGPLGIPLPSMPGPKILCGVGAGT